jgi:hypothetical protein
MGMQDSGRSWLNRLWCGTAVLGIGASLWAFWLTYDDSRDRAASEREIAQACAGLVSGEDVMDLRGGTVRAATDGAIAPEAPAPGWCQVYGVPGPGRSEGLLTLSVRTSVDGEPLHTVGDEVSREPFTYDFGEGDPTRRADRPDGRPLGDGSLGSYTDRSVTVRAECAAGTSDEGPGLLTVTARADYDDVSGEDLSRLASLAHGATERAAAALSCETRLPELPDRLDPPSRSLGAADTADGSCAWYGRHPDRAEEPRLPDRALDLPTAPRAAEEYCLLAMSPDRVRSVPLKHEDAADYGNSAVTHSPWWLRTASYFGADARSVGRDDLRDEYRALAPGTAGVHRSGVLWASSVCDGEPALHTLTLSYTYDGLLAELRKPLFEAYVTDITDRRGCTDVKLPRESDYRD